MLITEYDGCIFSSVLVMFLIAFNLLYVKKRFDLVFLFVNMHITTLALYLLYQSYWLNYITLGFLLLNILFILGFVAGYYLIPRRKGYIVNSDIGVPKILYRLNLIGFFFVLFASLYELKTAMWVFPIFAANKLLAYIDFPQKFVHYLVVSGTCVSSVAFFLIQRFRYRKIINWSVILIITIFYSFMLARAVLMLQLFSLVYIWVSESKIRLNFKTIGIGVIFTLFLTNFLGNIRTTEDTWTILDIGRMKNWPAWSISLSWIYLYFTTALENFRFGYESIEDYKYGAISILLPIFTLLQNKELELVNIGVDVSAGGFNTSGYGLSAYADFGYMGFLYTFFLGLLSKVVINSKKSYVYLFAAIWTYTIFTSAVNNYFNAFFIYVYFAYYFFIFRLARLFKNQKISKNSRSWV